jgi:hypothetical protein
MLGELVGSNALRPRRADAAEHAGVITEFLEDPDALAQRAKILLHQIQFGLGYFGQPLNYVPLIQFDVLQRQISEILKLYMPAEDAINQLVVKVRALQDTVADALSTEDHIKVLIGDINKQQSSAIDLANNLAFIIAELQTEIQLQRKVLTDRENEYQAAVAAASHGCSLNNVLTIVSAIVALAGAAFTAGQSLWLLAGTAVSSGLQIFKSVKVKGADGIERSSAELNPTYRQLLKTSATIPDVVEKFNALKKDLDVDPDSARLVLPQEDFDKLTANFDSDVDKAEGVDQTIKDAFKQAAHRFADLVQARNKKDSRARCIITSDCPARPRNSKSKLRPTEFRAENCKDS